jgi:hypothetical protein
LPVACWKLRRRFKYSELGISALRGTWEWKLVPRVIERIVKVFSALLACAWLASFSVGGAQGEPLAFAGFHRDMDLAALLDRYPQSAHEVSPGAGVRRRTSQDDLKGWIREFFRTRSSSGTYVLRMTPGESHDHLYYVQAEVREGITERLWLLLEMPLDLVNPRQPARGNEARYPACNDLLSPLTAKFGKPEALAPRWEEALQSFDYVWTHSPEVMKLQCGRYSGRESVFAIGVTLEQTAPR